MKLFGQKPTLSAWFGLIVVTLFIFIALFTPWLAPYPESANIGGTWAEPSEGSPPGGRYQTFPRPRTIQIGGRSVLCHRVARYSAAFTLKNTPSPVTLAAARRSAAR